MRCRCSVAWICLTLFRCSDDAESVFSVLTYEQDRFGPGVYESWFLDNVGRVHEGAPENEYTDDVAGL